MGFVDAGQGAASIVFLVVYLILGAVLAHTIAKRRPLRRFIGLAIFDAIRVGSQIAGIGFAVQSYSNFSWLIACAEGYFALVLTSLYILIGYQYENWGRSWLHHNITQEEEPSRLRRRLKKLNQPATWFHLALIPANVLTIYGGTSQSSSDGTNYTTNSQVTTGRALRAAGQALFLVLNIIFVVCVAATISQAQKRRTDMRPLCLLLATGPFFIVRGVFGILTSALVSWSFYNPDNYGADGLSTHVLVVDELQTTYEFIAACLALSAALIVSYPKGQKPNVGRGLDEEDQDAQIKQETL